MVVELTVGVPEIMPEVVLKVSPVGNAGSMAHVATTPPELENVMSVISVPRVNFTLVAEPVITATGSLIVIEMVTVAVPPELFAYTL